MTKHWDQHEIKAEVHRKGSTLVGIARSAGLEPTSTRTALRRRNRRGEAAIAAFLGVAPAVLWPDRYRPAPRPTASPKRGAH